MYVFLDCIDVLNHLPFKAKVKFHVTMDGIPTFFSLEIEEKDSGKHLTFRRNGSRYIMAQVSGPYRARGLISFASVVKHLLHLACWSVYSEQEIRSDKVMTPQTLVAHVRKHYGIPAIPTIVVSELLSLLPERSRAIIPASKLDEFRKILSKEKYGYVKKQRGREECLRK